VAIELITTEDAIDFAGGRLELTLPWEDIEDPAKDQIVNALMYPRQDPGRYAADRYIVKRLAIMRDVHAGYDLPIGSVALLDGYIWPGAVGYDIGCGMCHVNTGITYGELGTTRTDIKKRVLSMIPVGFDSRKTKSNGFERFRNASKYKALADAVNMKAAWQVGTLGGGNHFLEYGISQRTEEVGVTIHSGSRKSGYNIGDFYMRMSGGPIPLESELGQQYLADMNWALSFALRNRELMMKKALKALGLQSGQVRRLMMDMVNENHNHATVTDDGVIHRKGATPASKGDIGIIPANMRDGVWITEGLGNKECLESAPHGCGRTMSRTRAKKTIDMADHSKSMDGIMVSQPVEKLLDESAYAYKDIGYVLSGSSKLIRIIDNFRPILVVKG